MTLVVDFSEFCDAVKRFGAGDGDCVMHRRVRGSVLLTYVNAQSGVQVVSFHPGPEQDAIAAVQARGLCLMKGMWATEASLEHLEQIAGEAYIAAVSYETKDGPGLWMDAYPVPPSEGSVLRGIFDEFVSEGLLSESDFERFIHEARPIVRVLDPDHVERFLKMKVERED
jgi:hypothetical protein